MRSKKLAYGAFFLVVLALSLLPLYTSDYIVSLLLNILMWSALTESWVILSGYVGYISLGHAAFFGIGAYIMAIYWGALPFTLLVPLGGVASAAVALAVGFPCLRVRGPYFVILTLGLAEFAKYLFINWEVNVKGTVGHLLMGAPGIRTFYYSMLIIAIVTTLVTYLVKNSRFGLGLISIRENEEAAEALGINTSLYKWLAFGLSAFFAGLVGAVMAPRWTYIDPYTVFDPIVSFQVIIIAFLGGTEEVSGPLLGAVILTLLSELLWARYPYYYLIILGVVLILIVKFLPAGVFAPVKKLALKKSLGPA